MRPSRVPTSRPYAVTLTLALLAAGTQGAAQPAGGVIDGRPSCPDCRIELRPDAVLGDAEGPGALAGQPLFLLRTGAGQWITAENPFATRLAVFGDRGVYERDVGRAGAGPGEYEGIVSALIGRDGRVYVFDAALRRATVLEPDLSYRETFPLGELMLHRTTQDGRGVIYYNADVTTRDAIGLPLHVLEGGAVRRSFGMDTPVYRPDAPWLTMRAMAPAESGVWAARRTEYRIEKWTAAGENTDVWRREADWFTPYLQREPITPQRPPRPWVVAMHPMGDSLLAVAVAVADPGLARNLRLLRESPRGPVYDVSNCPEVFDTIIEVIDVRNGRLVTSIRRDECILGFTGGFAYGYRLDDGVPRIDVYEVRVGGIAMP